MIFHANRDEKKMKIWKKFTIQHIMVMGIDDCEWEGIIKWEMGKDADYVRT